MSSSSVCTATERLKPGDAHKKFKNQVDFILNHYTSLLRVVKKVYNTPQGAKIKVPSLNMTISRNDVTAYIKLVRELIKDLKKLFGSLSQQMRASTGSRQDDNGYSLPRLWIPEILSFYMNAEAFGKTYYLDNNNKIVAVPEDVMSYMSFIGGKNSSSPSQATRVAPTGQLTQLNSIYFRRAKLADISTHNNTRVGKPKTQEYDHLNSTAIGDIVYKELSEKERAAGKTPQPLLQEFSTKYMGADNLLSSVFGNTMNQLGVNPSDFTHQDFARVLSRFFKRPSETLATLKPPPTFDEQQNLLLTPDDEAYMSKYDPKLIPEDEKELWKKYYNEAIAKACEERKAASLAYKAAYSGVAIKDRQELEPIKDDAAAAFVDVDKVRVIVTQALGRELSPQLQMKVNFLMESQIARITNETEKLLHKNRKSGGQLQIL